MTLRFPGNRSVRSPVGLVRVGQEVQDVPQVERNNLKMKIEKKNILKTNEMLTKVQRNEQYTILQLKCVLNFIKLKKARKHYQKRIIMVLE